MRASDPARTVIRQASPADLPAIRRLVRAAYAPYRARMDRQPAPMLRDYQAEAEAGQIWVLGEPIAGVIVLVPGPDSMLIENVAVQPVAQGLGLGRRLMEFAEQRAAESKLRRLTLYTNEVMTENLAIYARLGYREVERRSEDGYRRVFMDKPLPG
jgi:N-acetylglutamate synthase-like GNAT family acetyltransferase